MCASTSVSPRTPSPWRSGRRVRRIFASPVAAGDARPPFCAAFKDLSFGFSMRYSSFGPVVCPPSLWTSVLFQHGWRDTPSFARQQCASWDARFLHVRPSIRFSPWFKSGVSAPRPPPFSDSVRLSPPPLCGNRNPALTPWTAWRPLAPNPSLLDFKSLSAAFLPILVLRRLTACCLEASAAT